MARVKIKVERGNGLQQVVTVDTEATKGARLGRDVYLPDGTVATPASMRSWMGVSQGTAAPTAGASLQSVLTNKGDLATRNSQVQRLGIGTQDQVLRVSAAGLPEWRSGAALTKTDDTNVTLTLGGSPDSALLSAASITVGWSGTLAQGRGGWGADISAANGYPKFTAGVAAFGSTVPWGDVSSTPTTLGGYGITDAYTDSEVDGIIDTLVDTYLPANYQPLSSVLTAYAGGSTPSAFTLGIVDSVDAAAWRAAIGAGTSNFDGAFSSLSGVPTTLAGYGITDAYTDSEVDGLLAGYTPTSGLAAVALSNDYGDLDNLPSLFDGDWGSLANIPAIVNAFAGLPNASGVLTNDGSGNLSWAPAGGSGTVTSVGLSAPTGLSVSGSPVTTSGTLALSWAAGYQGYTTTEASKLSGIAPGATVGATWGTNLNSIPPIISTFAALANGSGVLTNDGSGNLSWSAGGAAGAGTVGSALNRDPFMLDEDAWEVVSGGPVVFDTISDGAVGLGAARSSPGVEADVIGRDRIPIDPAKSYRVSALLRTISGSGSDFYMGVAAFDADGNLLDANGDYPGNGTWWYYAAAGTAPGTFTRYTGTFGNGTAKPFPPNARTMAPLFILSYGGGTAAHEIQDLRIEEVSAAAWGSITGTLSDQTDLQSALDGKQASSSVLTAYAGGNTPSAFTLGIVDAVDAAAWRTAIGAGTSSLTIGGSNTQIQFNNGGVLGGSPGLTWDGSTLTATNLAGSGAGITGVVHTTGDEAIGGFKRFTSTVNIRGDDAHGYISANVGGVSNSGYLAFYAPGGTRQGYIGWSSSSASTDTGTIPYVAGTHAFTGNVTVTGGVQLGSPTGGDKGAGTLNTAGNIFLNNNPVPCIVSGGTAGGGRITISTSAPSGTPADGDMWFQNGIWVGRSGAWAPVANSGTYTPTGAAGVNVSSVTVEECQYLRVGSVVTVSGRVTVTVSSSGTAAFYLTLPVASDLTDQNDLGGIASTTAGNVWAVRPDVTINRALFETMAASSGARVLYFTFTYSII